MDAKSSQSSFLQNLKFKPEYLIRAAPLGVAIALAGASLLPMIRAGSPELLMGAAVLSGLGTDIIKDFVKRGILLLGKKTDEEILKETEDEILKLWNAPDEKGAKFRRELSQFLRQNGILQMALNDAPDEMKGALVDSFAKLANDFDEFSWVLTDIQKLLVETSAMVRHNVEISNEILTKVNLLAKIQREREEKPSPPPMPTDKDETNDLPPADIPCPYKGLAAFQPQDVEYFYGRETLTAQLLANLAGASFLAVVGPSGSGKSSLVRAGVIPALWNGEIPGSENWKTLIMRPGTTPLEELGVCVASESKSVASELVEGLRKSEQALRLELKKYLINQSQDAKFILVIDQFEEIFTQCKDESEREKFIAALVDAAQNGDARMVVILTLRADFYGHCAPYPALAKLLSENQVLVGTMSADELRRAIKLPAEKVGLAIEPGLADLILEEVQGEAGPLPMISHALVETWKLRRGRWLKVDTYRSFGGIKKAIASTADEVFAKFTDAEREQVRDIFLRLTRVDENTASDEYRDVRQRVLLRDLIPAGGDSAQTERLLDNLADARLIVKDMGRNSQVEVEVAHEALITHWDKLRGWLNENREALRLHQNVSEATHDWLANDRDENLLVHRGGRLEDALELRAKLNSGEKDYLDACVALIERGKKAREVLRRRITIGLATGLALALVLAGFAIFQTMQAQKQAQIAMARQLSAQAQTIISRKDSKQQTAVLLAVQSMRMFPNGEAARILQNNTLAKQITRITHDSWVNSIAFSPDGKYVVSGSDDGTALVWEASTGKEIAHITHDRWVNSVAFDPTGKYVVSGSKDNTARVWEAMTGKEIARITHDGGVDSVAFSPDGKYVVSGSIDNTARVWEAITGKEIARMTHDGSVHSVAFGPDGKYVVSGSGDGTARVWEAFTGREITRMTHDDSVYSVAFSPDGKYVVSGSVDNTARVWEASTGKEIARMTHDDSVYSVAFSPDGKYVVSGSEDGTARVWEATTGKESSRMTHDGEVNSVAFSPDGKVIISSSSDGTERIWGATTGNEIARMTHTVSKYWVSYDSRYAIAFSPDGRYLASGSNDDGTARVWEATTGKEIARMIHDDGVFSIVLSSDGKYLVSGSLDNTARVWEATTGKEIARMIHENWVFSVAFSPDGKYVVSGGQNNTARVWEATTGKEIARMIHSDPVKEVAFSPDGKYVVSVSRYTIHVWEATTGKEIARMTHDDWVNSVAYSSDGKYVVSGGNDTARVWEATTGNEITRMAHVSEVSSVAFNPDGRYVVSGSKDNTVCVWDATTGKEIARMTHDDGVYSVAFSQDGKYVVSGSWDNTARVWEAFTGKEIAHITHDGWVHSVAFNSNGKYVVSGSADNTARVWEATTGKEIARMTHDGGVDSVAFSPDDNYVVSGGDNTARVWMWRSNDLINNSCSRVTRNLTHAEWQQYIGDALPYQAVCPNLPIEAESTPTP